MQARIKKNARYPTLNFFSGVEFVKSEWRPVPPGREEEARANDWLEVADEVPVARESGVAVPPTITEPAPPKSIEPAVDVRAVVEVSPEVVTLNTAKVVEPEKPKTVTNNTSTRNHNKRGR
jgi:hypothetical protein